MFFCLQCTRFVRLDLKLERSVVCLRFVGNIGLIKVFFFMTVSSGSTHNRFSGLKDMMTDAQQKSILKSPAQVPPSHPTIRNPWKKVKQSPQNEEKRKGDHNLGSEEG